MTIPKWLAGILLFIVGSITICYVIGILSFLIPQSLYPEQLFVDMQAEFAIGYMLGAFFTVILVGFLLYKVIIFLWKIIES